MSILQAIKRRFVKGPCFEVMPNRGGEWFWHERASNGKIKSVSESYASRGNAIRAARAKVAETPGSTWKVLDR